MNLCMSNFTPQVSLKYLDSPLPEGMRLDHLLCGCSQKYLDSLGQLPGSVRLNTPQVLPEYSLHIGYLVNTNSANVNDIH